MSNDKSIRSDKAKVKEHLVEEIAIAPAGSPDANLLDRVSVENAESDIKVRKKTRTTRNDINASVRRCGVFRSKVFQPVKLVDISQLGAAVATEKTMRLNDRVQLKLQFIDGIEFTVDARITRAIEDASPCYGLCFVRADRRLSEHLLKTGLKLKLKS